MQHVLNDRKSYFSRSPSPDISVENGDFQPPGSQISLTIANQRSDTVSRSKAKLLDGQGPQTPYQKAGRRTTMRPFRSTRTAAADCCSKLKDEFYLVASVAGTNEVGAAVL